MKRNVSIESRIVGALLAAVLSGLILLLGPALMAAISKHDNFYVAAAFYSFTLSWRGLLIFLSSVALGFLVGDDKLTDVIGPTCRKISAAAKGPAGMYLVSLLLLSGIVFVIRWWAKLTFYSNSP